MICVSRVRLLPFKGGTNTADKQRHRISWVCADGGDAGESRVWAQEVLPELEGAGQVSAVTLLSHCFPGARNPFFQIFSHWPGIHSLLIGSSPELDKGHEGRTVYINSVTACTHSGNTTASQQSLNPSSVARFHTSCFAFLTPPQQLYSIVSPSSHKSQRATEVTNQWWESEFCGHHWGRRGWDELRDTAKTTTIL